jgi:hypothetical protein
LNQDGDKIIMVRKLLLVVGIVATLLLGVSAVGAQDATATTAPQPERPGLQAMRIVGNIVAQETGLTLREITQQVRQGQTLSDIIQANGGDVQAVIDQSVTQLTDAINQVAQSGSITQTRATNLLSNLQDVVTKAVNGERFPTRIDRTAVRRQPAQVLVQATADATGLRAPQIVAQLAQGKTLADIITANGGTVDAVVNNAVAAATDQINTAVQEQRLTQNQGDELIPALPTLLTEMVNGQLRQQAAQILVGAAVIRLAAQQTGLTAQEIRQELSSGKTLADVLTEHNVDTNAFIDSAVAQAQQRLNQAVANKRITQARADQMLENFRTQLTNGINRVGALEAVATPA